LPAEQLHAALLTLRSLAVGGIAGFGPEDEQAARAEAALRRAYDESASRIGLAARLVMGLGGAAVTALSLEHGGVALFLTALALGSGQPREAAALCTHETQSARLALSLRVAGLSSTAVQEQLVQLHRDVVLPVGLDRLDANGAASILAGGRYGRA